MACYKTVTIEGALQCKLDPSLQILFYLGCCNFPLPMACYKTAIIEGALQCKRDLGLQILFYLGCCNFPLPMACYKTVTTEGALLCTRGPSLQILFYLDCCNFLLPMTCCMASNSHNRKCINSICQPPGLWIQPLRPNFCLPMQKYVKQHSKNPLL